MLVCCAVGIDSPHAAPVAHHTSQQQGAVERESGSCQTSAKPTAEETAVSFHSEPWVNDVADRPSSSSSCEEDSSSTSSQLSEDNGVPGMLSCVSAVAFSCVAPDSNSNQNFLLHAMLVMPLWICLWIIAEETVTILQGM